MRQVPDLVKVHARAARVAAGEGGELVVKVAHELRVGHVGHVNQGG